MESSVEKLKTQGNDAFKQGKYQQALSFYQRALDLCLPIEPKAEAIIHANKAACLNFLKKPKDAIECANKALRLDPSYDKAKFRLLQSYIDLAQWDKADGVIDDLKYALEKDKAPYIARLFREKELELGFDWEEMIRKSFANEAIDLKKDYINMKVEIAAAEKTGVGIIARKPLKQGELIMCQKAIVYVSAKDIAQIHTQTTKDARIFDEERNKIIAGGVLLHKLEEKIKFDPNLKSKILKLASKKNSLLKDIIDREDLYPKDQEVSRETLADIISYNAYQMLGFDVTQKDGTFVVSNGLWMHPSFLNHSCNANAVYFQLNGVFAVRALKPIAEKEEVVISYIEETLFKDKQPKLMDKWGFLCTCEICIARNDDKVEAKNKALREIEESMEAKDIEKYFTALDQYYDNVLDERNKMFSSLFYSTMHLASIKKAGVSEENFKKLRAKVLIMFGWFFLDNETLFDQFFTHACSKVSQSAKQ
jgi:tetratricopeptide (TPR) repeat protein